MVPYANTIEPAVMTEDSMKLKKTFTDLTPVLLQGMCQQLTFGQPAALASGALANLQGVMQVRRIPYRIKFRRTKFWWKKVPKFLTCCRKFCPPKILPADIFCVFSAHVNF